MTTITLNNLTIGYPAKGSVKTVMRRLNAIIRGGELTCLIGPNGVGKSTLLRTLAAFQPPIEGTVTLTLGDDAQTAADTEPGGHDARPASLDLHRQKPSQLSRLVGVVLTERPDVQNLSVRELVSLGRSPYTGFWGRCTEADYEVVDCSLEQVGIAALARRNVATLSDGERQKVMIAKALAQQTPVVFLDEPTAFLDFPSKVEVMKLLRTVSHATGKTIFLSTHDVEMALQLADTLWLARRPEGKNQAERNRVQPDSPVSDSPEPVSPLSIGSPAQLAADGTLSAYFSGPGIEFDPRHIRLSVKA